MYRTLKQTHMCRSSYDTWNMRHLATIPDSYSEMVWCLYGQSSTCQKTFRYPVSSLSFCGKVQPAVSLSVEGVSDVDRLLLCRVQSEFEITRDGANVFDNDEVEKSGTRDIPELTSQGPCTPVQHESRQSLSPPASPTSPRQMRAPISSHVAPSSLCCDPG